MKLFIFLVLLNLCSTWVYAQPYLGIPTKYSNNPAVDLVKGGQVLLPDEVHELIVKTKGRFDISTLDPIETSDLWKNTFPKTLPQDKNPVGDLEEVSYHSNVATSSGLYRFNIYNKSGDGKIYTMMLGKTIHSMLLAKSLLRKIGYQIPDMKYIPRTIINFKSAKEKAEFIAYMEIDAQAGSSKSWIAEDLGDTQLILQDLVVMESNHVIYNLAVGITDDMIQSRRLLSSLLVPLTIVNVSESINMLRWTSGVINSNHVALFKEDQQDFQCSWEDARWIGRRIEKLSRADWEEIVASTHTPKSVQLILLEKLISRRNSILKLFKIDSAEMKVDPDVSNGIELIKGKLTQNSWPGYASRFSFGDPESPLARSEMSSFLMAKGMSAFIDSGISYLNKQTFMGTDIKKKNEEILNDFKLDVEDAMKKAEAEKKTYEVPVKGWIYPTFRGQLILSRNIVTGTYLGTDNLVQLADTIGVAVGAGAFVGTVNVLPSPVNLYGSAAALFVRSYSHLRPVTSMQRALKYPFKNIMVPLVKADYGKKLHKAARLNLDENADEEERLKAIEDAFKPLKESMDVGESLIVTDSLATYAGATVIAGKKLLRASLGVVPGNMVVSRFHVHRKTADEFHLYRDLGDMASLALNFTLESYLPVLKVGIKKSTGAARVKFFRININPENPKAIQNASLLRRALVWSSTSDMEDKEDTKPFVISHSFKESNPTMNLIFWQWNKLTSSTNITITYPQGEKRKFKRLFLGTTKGRNYQEYVTNSISRLSSVLWGQSLDIGSGSGSNPGYSYKGSASTKLLSYDQEIDNDGKTIEPFIRISRVWNGWSIDQKGALKIIEDMKNRYRHEFFSGPILNSTKRLFLYNISVSMLFYKAGIEHLLTLDNKVIEEIFRTHRSIKDLSINPLMIQDEKEANAKSGAVDFLKYLARFKNYEKKGNKDKANKNLLKAFSKAEGHLNIAGITKLLGGVDNLYLNSKIEGYREGDEDGDRTIVSDSLGEFGSMMRLGPIVHVQQENNMLEGEFFIYWLMTRLI